jgi:hypothetical protein
MVSVLVTGLRPTDPLNFLATVAILPWRWWRHGAPLAHLLVKITGRRTGLPDFHEIDPWRLELLTTSVLGVGQC